MKRETWVDGVKVLACVLVVLGHLFQSMVKSGIIESGKLYNLFIQTIYCFHVQLFFICSGYLFQRHSIIRTFKEWKYNVLRKLTSLGIPYFFFSLITWGIKKVFSSSVNNEAGDLIDALFFHPLSPYWYLYILFFVFVISITITKKKELYVILAIAVFLKILSIMQINTGINLFDKIADMYIWFVFGITLAYSDLSHYTNTGFSFIALILFCVASVLKSFEIIVFKGESFILGFLACFSIISIIQKNSKPSIFISFCSEYTFPIYLMHTIFAALFRSILFKAGISNAWIHISLGLVVSFIGPVLAMILLQKLHPLDFLVYPSRYIKINK